MAATGIPMSFIMVLNEDVKGNPATGDTAKLYADALEIQGVPVLADSTYQTYSMTPWDGVGRPGKCALAPDMTLLKCYAGEDDALGYAAIQAHAGAASAP